jgi:hypothetical protein
MVKKLRIHNLAKLQLGWKCNVATDKELIMILLPSQGAGTILPLQVVNRPAKFCS